MKTDPAAAATQTAPLLAPPAPAGGRMQWTPEAGWQWKSAKPSPIRDFAVKVTGRAAAALLATLALTLQVRAGARLAWTGRHGDLQFGNPTDSGTWPLTLTTAALVAALTAAAWAVKPATFTSAARGAGIGAAAAVTGTGILLGRVGRRWPRGTALTASVAWSASSCIPAVGEWLDHPLPSLTGGVLCLAGGVAARITHEIRERRKPTPTPVRTVHPKAAIWRVKVAAVAQTLPDGRRIKDGPLPGCLVADDVQPLLKDGVEVGVRLRVTGRDLAQNVDTIRAAVPAIAAAYATTPEGVTLVEVGDHQRCILEITDSAHLAQRKAERQCRIRDGAPLPGPCLDTAFGVIQIGIRADDGGPLEWQLWLPGQGARHGWIVGAQGSGKTGGLSELLASACSGGVVVPHIIDLGRSSLPEWKRYAASWATNVPDAVRVLRNLEQLYEARIEWMEEQELSCYPDPSTDTPMHLVVVEEAPELTGNAEAMRIVIRLVRLARKTGIGLIWVTQFGNADKAFGLAGTVMREQLKAGNIWMFALTGESIGQALSGARDEAADTLFDQSQIGIPKGVTGACVAWTPRHSKPTLGRSWWWDEPLRRDDLARWVVLPHFDWADILPDQAEEDAVIEASVPAEVRGNAARVLAEIRRNHAPGSVLSTGQVLTLVPDMPESSLQYALQVLHKRRVLIDGGHGKWELAS